MPRVVHFEISATDPERASKFYSSVFNWEIKKWEGAQPYWLVTTGKEGEGINGGIMQGNPSTVNFVAVDNLDSYVAKVTANKGTVVEARIDIPDVGSIAYCKDTEGNTFGIIQPSGMQHPK